MAEQDRLFPLTSFRRAGDGWLGVALRVTLGLAVLAYFIYLSSVPDIVDDVRNAVMKAHDDVWDYGINKIAFNFTNINSKSLAHHIIEDDIEESAGPTEPNDEN